MVVYDYYPCTLLTELVIGHLGYLVSMIYECVGLMGIMCTYVFVYASLLNRYFLS